MKIVTPETKTTLMLNRYMEPFNECTARSTLRHLINGGFTGFDAADVPYTWDGRDPDFNPKEVDPSTGKLKKAPPLNPINWSSLNIQVFADQPVLRSAPVAGQEKCWYIPTVVRCNRTFGYRPKHGKEVPLHVLYKIYKKQCQYCHQFIPFSEATIDHLYPKSRGGSNEEDNLVLACRSCNNQKDSQYPYYDKDGKLPKIRRRLPSGMYVPENPRPEWVKYIPGLEDS